MGILQGRKDNLNSLIFLMNRVFFLFLSSLLLMLMFFNCFFTTAKTTKRNQQMQLTPDSVSDKQYINNGHIRKYSTLIERK